MFSEIYPSASRYIEVDKGTDLRSVINIELKKNLIVGEEWLISRYRIDTLFDSFNSENYIYYFKGECAQEFNEDIARFAADKKIAVITAFGGGKVMDASKHAAEIAGCSIITYPSSPATCASFTPVSVMYTKEGIFERYNYLSKSPDCLIMDWNILLDCPVRYYASGAGDSIAKYYESLPAVKAAAAGAEGLFLKVPAYILEESMRYLRYNLPRTGSGDMDILKHIARINIFFSGLVSGLGGENFGTGIPHFTANALTAYKKAREKLHGEAAVFGTLLERYLENEDDYRSLAQLMGAACLPCRLSAFGITEAEIDALAQKIIKGNEDEGNTAVIDPKALRFALGDLL